MKVTGLVLLTFFTALGWAALLSIPGAWLMMLILGGLHSQIVAVPALGFWFVWLSLMAIRIIVIRTSA